MIKQDTMDSLKESAKNLMFSRGYAKTQIEDIVNDSGFEFSSGQGIVDMKHYIYGLLFEDAHAKLEKELFGWKCSGEIDDLDSSYYQLRDHYEKEDTDFIILMSAEPIEERRKFFHIIQRHYRAIFDAFLFAQENSGLSDEDKQELAKRHVHRLAGQVITSAMDLHIADEL